MDEVRSGSQLTKFINDLETLYYIKTAWEKVSPATIQNCFKKVRFHKNNNHSSLFE